MSAPFVDGQSYQAQGSTIAGAEPEAIPIDRLPPAGDGNAPRASLDKPYLTARGLSEGPVVGGHVPTPAPTAEFPVQKIWPTAIVVMIHMTTYGAVLVAFNKLLLDLNDGDSSKASLATGLFNAVPQLLQFVLNPFYGVLSDVGFGRRKFMVMSVSIMGGLLVLVAISPTLTSVFIAAVVRGATDSTFSIAAACITDVSPTQKHYLRNFGIVGAAIGGAVILGPGAGALLTLVDAHTLPFWVGAGFCAINVLFLLFVFKETRAVLPREQRVINWAHANPFNNWKMLLTTKRMIYFVVCSWLIEGTLGIVGVWFLFSKEMYDWDTTENGVFLAFFGLVGVIAQGVVLPFASKRLNTTQLMYSSMFCACFMYCAFAVAFQSWALYVIVFITAYGSLLMPVLRGELSKEVGKAQQGQLQGAFSSCLITATVLGNLLMSGVFSYFISDSAFVYLPTAPFIVAAILALVAALLQHLGLKVPPQYAPDAFDPPTGTSDNPIVGDTNPASAYLAQQQHLTDGAPSPRVAGNGETLGVAASPASITTHVGVAFSNGANGNGNGSALGNGHANGASVAAGATETSPLMTTGAADSSQTLIANPH